MAGTTPGDLELVRSFVNTLDCETGVDELADPSALRAWLVAHRLLERSAPVTSAEVARTAAVREALRSLLAANNRGRLDPDAIATLEAAVEWTRLTIVFDGRARMAVEPGRPGVAGSVGRLLTIAARAMADGRWERLKACSAEGCAWAFYDRTRNRSGRWCSMAVCGNRAKVRAYRARRRAG